MTVISWLLEFLSGGVAMAIKRLATTVNTINGLEFLDLCLTFIIIPSSYILNTEATKAFVVAEGWCQAFKGFFQSNGVDPVPNENIEMEVVQNAVPSPTPTISGNIQEPSLPNQPEQMMSVLEMLS